MTQEAPVTTEVPRFDVVARLPSNARLEDVQERAVAAGIRPDRVEALIKALRTLPSVKIGAAVDRERADKAREQFSAAGLTVEITPVLALAPMMTGAFDTRFECPNCGQRVDLPENRQCPHCGVFVDKVTPEMILRRKLREKEKLALDFRLQRDQQAAERAAREALENQVREEVRRELEAELGLGKGRMTVNRNLLVGGAVLVAVAAFGAGLVSSGGLPFEGAFAGKADQPVQDARSKGLLDQLDKLDKGAAKGGDTAAAARANGGPATGDPDVDDPLVQAAGGKRIGAKGISVEQAVQAAQTLAKAAGYKGAGTEAAVAAPGDPTATLEARIEGGGATPAPAAGAAPGGAGSAAGNAPGGAPGGAPAGTAAAAPAGTDAAAAAATATAVQVSPRVRALIAVDLARTVAQVGQVARAREMIKALHDNPAYRADPALVEAIAQATVEIRAWSLHTQTAGGLRAAAEAVLGDARILPTPLARVQALAAAGAIAARHPLLPPETARLFLTAAAEALKSVEGPQQARGASLWSVALGEVMLHEATHRARTGQWARANEVAAQIESLAAQAPDGGSGARLRALEHQARLLVGQPDKAAAALTTALGQVGKEARVADRATLLRSLAHLGGGATDERMAAAIEQVKAAAQAAAPAERAVALMHLALLHAEAGLRGRAGEYTQLALATPGLGKAEAGDLHAELLLRGDLATAQSLHQVGLYAEAESALRRLGALVL